MDDVQAFARRLEEALEAKRNQLDRADLPKLKESWKLFQTSYGGIHSVLYKKGIIHDDPYRYELKISEVTNPPEGPFSESEKIDQMSLRLSQFEAYLDFLNNYYQFDTEFLTLGRIKRLLGLVKYFNFCQLSGTNNQLNTRCLAELVDMVRKGSDPMSSGIITEAIGQLDKATKDILAILKDLAAYHRERYKLELRQLVLPGLGLDMAYVSSKKDEAVKLVKRKFAELSGERPFFPELVEELLLEDYSSDGPGLREEVIARLKVKEEKKTEKSHSKSFRSIVLDGIRILAGVNYQLDDSVTKLRENSAILEARDQGFFVKLKRMFAKILSPGDNGIFYEIELLDPISGERTAEKVDFAAFTEEAAKKARLLASLLQRGGPTMKRLENAPEEQAFKFLERNMEDLQGMLKRLAALDEFFKSEVGPEDRNRLRGLKSELTTIKGSLIKANQKKHEYVAQREEQEQMKRLGIHSD